MTTTWLPPNTDKELRFPEIDHVTYLFYHLSYTIIVEPILIVFTL